MLTSTSAQITAVIEIALALGGLWFLWQRLPRGQKREPASALSNWKVSSVDLGMLVWLVLIGGLTAQLFGMAVLKQIGFEGTTLLILASAIFQLGMLSGCLGFIFFTAAGKSFDWPRRKFIREGVSTFMIAIAPVFAIGYAWQSLLRLFGVPVEQQDMVMLFRNTDNLPLLGFMIVLASGLAPLVEELVFRAGVFRFLHGRLPAGRAVLLSAAFFGCIHVNLASFPQLTLLGVLFAWSYARTGNLAVPMLAHALFNLNTILLILFGVDF